MAPHLSRRKRKASAMKEQEKKKEEEGGERSQPQPFNASDPRVHQAFRTAAPPADLALLLFSPILQSIRERLQQSESNMSVSTSQDTTGNNVSAESANISPALQAIKGKGKAVDESSSSISRDIKNKVKAVDEQTSSDSQDIKGKGKAVDENSSSVSQDTTGNGEAIDQTDPSSSIAATTTTTTGKKAKKSKKSKGKGKAAQISTTEPVHPNLAAIQETIDRLALGSNDAKTPTKGELADLTFNPTKARKGQGSSSKGSSSRDAADKELSNLSKAAAEVIQCLEDRKFLDDNYCKSNDVDEINQFYEKKIEDHELDLASFIRKKKQEIDACLKRIGENRAIQDDHVQAILKIFADMKRDRSEEADEE